MRRAPQLIICSKSTWAPAIRREHALALEASRDGFRVTFVERPLDVRSLMRPAERRAWIRAILGRQLAGVPRPEVTVRSRATVVPAHRSWFALQVDALLLERALRRIPGAHEATVVATLPWQWPAVSRVAAARRVLDYADDWEALVPGSEGTIRRLLDRAEREADAITVASSDLREVFRYRQVAVVRNGVSDEVLRPIPQPPPGISRMVYLGTLSDRFDAPLLRDVLARLPDRWTLELYGPCQYPRLGGEPNEELRSLLRHPRVTWRGAIERDRVAAVLDRADVLVVPHRRVKPGSGCAHPSWRGDAMKFYDYAARGRPIISTNWADGLRNIGPPELHLVDDARAFAARVLQTASSASIAALSDQRAWAARHDWRERWKSWSEAAGVGMSADVGEPAGGGIGRSRARSRAIAH